MINTWLKPSRGAADVNADVAFFINEHLPSQYGGGGNSAGRIKSSTGVGRG